MSPEDAKKLAEYERESILELIADLEEYTDFLKHSMTSNEPQATLPYEWAESIQHVALKLNYRMTRLCVLEPYGGLP